MGPLLKKARNPYEIHRDVANPDTSATARPVGPPPKINFADVETRLNMHQFNGFFEASSPERKIGDTPGGRILDIGLRVLFMLLWNSKTKKADVMKCFIMI